MDALNQDIEALIKENQSLQSQLDKATEDYYELVNKTNLNLKELFDSSNDLIQIIKPDGEFRFVNQTWKFKMGYTDEELFDFTFIDLIHPEKRKETLEIIKKSGDSQSGERITTILESKFGKSIYLSGTVTCVFDRGKAIEYRCIFYDVTERMRAESAQRLYYSIAAITSQEQRLDDFFHNIFQELNKHLKVRNFSISLHKRDTFIFPFRVNEFKKNQNTKIDSLLSRYTLERGRPLIIYKEGIRKIATQYHSKLSEKLPEIWLGAPLNAGEKTGVMMIYSYRDHASYNNKDLELLDFISGQVGLAMQRQMSQDKIVDQAARLNAIFESSTHQIWSIDKSYSFTSFNENYAKSFQSYFGRRPEVGMSLMKTYQKLFSSEMRDFWIEKYNEAFRGKTLNFQTSITDDKENTIWRDIFLNPIFLPDGRIEEISVIANDITEKKNAENALINSEEKFRNIFESFQDIYFRCNTEGIITMVSPSVSEVLGFESEDVIGQNIGSFFIAKNKIGRLIKKLYENKRVRNFEGAIKTREGQKIQFLFNIRLLSNQQGETEIEGVARDITDLKETNLKLKEAKEIAERSLKIKERFLANMSHEIRTPMNGLIGMIDLLGTTQLNKKQSDYIRTLKKSSDTLLNILNDILDLSKIEAGKMELRKEPVRLIETIEKVYDLYSQQANTNNTQLYYHFGDKIPEYVMSDETRLMQVISNLTSNAIKFSHKKGTISISIHMIRESEDTFDFKVSVKDSGIGIHPKDQDKLFQSFSQIDSSNRKNYSGTGLGLAISRELVKSMGGDIGVVSTPGFGSTFWFTFTADKVSPNQLREKEKDVVLIQKFEKDQPKVLLVDDNQINRTVAVEILQQSGCKVKEAGSGKEAIQLVKKNAFDLIFMDIQMPEMDGQEASRKIRALNVKHKIPPIIAMTAYSMEEDRKKFIEGGMDDYLAKPIKSNQIIGKVKEWTRFEPKTVQNLVFEEKTEDLIINQNTLNQLYKFGGKELIETVLNDFDQEATQQVKESVSYLEEGNFEEIRSQMHTLKGNAGTLGIERVSKQAMIIEKKVKENKFDNLETEIKKLRKTLKEFKDSYRSLTESKTNEQENSSSRR